jgi:hypothetical protein
MVGGNRRIVITKTQIKYNYPDIYLKILTFESDYDNCLKTKFSSKPNKLVFHDCEQNYPKYYYDLNTILEEIRDRNKINTTLEQLFNRTLHLNESFDCIIGYRNGTIINCSQVYSLVEVFDGLNFFGKIFCVFQ